MATSDNCATTYGLSSGPLLTLDTLACTSVCLTDTFLSFWSAMARTKSFQKFKPPESQKVAAFGEEAIKLEPGH